MYNEKNKRDEMGYISEDELEELVSQENISGGTVATVLLGIAGITLTVAGMCGVTSACTKSCIK